jgi:hypothetical protein
MFLNSGKKTRSTFNLNENAGSFNSSYTGSERSLDVFEISNYKNLVYQNTEPAFTNSTVSTQDTLMSQNTNLTYSTRQSSIYSNSIKRNEDYDTRTKHSASSSPYKLENHFESPNKYSIHTAKKTLITNIPKNNIVLINDMPYPVQIQFPAKISQRDNQQKNNSQIEMDDVIDINMNKENSSFNSISDSLNSENNIIPLKESNLQTRIIQSGENKTIHHDLKRCDSYDLLMQVIDSYSN